jgi:DNA invertase Pin-like site-specific DNA recombinase
MKKTAIYARVSTTDQSYEMQVEKLREIAFDRKWEIVGEYKEKVSGAKSREKRPQLSALLDAIHKGEVNNVMVWKLDRLGRSVPDLINTTEYMKQNGCDLYSREDLINTNTAEGKLQFHVMIGFAQFQRDIILSNVKAGVERAREKGVKFGRPPIKVRRKERIKSKLVEGKSIRETAKELKESVGTVSRIRKLMTVDLGTFKVSSATKEE